MKLDLSSLRRIPSPAVTRLMAAIAGTVLLAMTAARVGREGHDRRLQLRAADSTLATFDEWRRRYRPAVAAESIAWRRAWMEVRDLGIVGDERLAVTRHVARAAEFAGLSGVRVTIGEPDTTGADARLSTGGVSRQNAPFGLVVECRGNLQAIIAFLGGLPPSVAVSGMRLVRQDRPGRHRLTLAVYELDFDAVPPSARAPVERGAAGGRGDDRAGG
jgi:hypothetical protein